MPVWLRNFTYKKIEEYYRKQNEKLEEQDNIISDTTKNIPKISTPNIPQANNTYQAKVPKK